MAIVVFIVVGLFMFTFKSTSFDAEGFILVSCSFFCTSVDKKSFLLILIKFAC